MDAVISTALSEICSQGTNGVSIKDLWPKLQTQLSSLGLDLCSGVKTSIWNGLLNIPGLQFKSQNNSSSFTSQDTSIRSFEKVQELNLKIVAPEHLRDCFVGLYDNKASDSGISPVQRRVLERLSVARTNGITQNQLAKEFGMKGNKIFYVVRSLEVRGLIVRQSTIVRTKENAAEGENELQNTPIVNTNLIRLHRYATHLNSQQRLEITKSDTSESFGNLIGGTSTSDGCAGGINDDVHVKDFLPAMEAICDKLEEADGKVLVVSDIKQALGYQRTKGHRAWRNICHRLEEARLVEVFPAEVNKKVVSCLRLLKKFDPKFFQPKHVGFTSDDLDIDQPVKCLKQEHIVEQLLDLPLEHQIYDMIDTERSNGLAVTEVCKRLGLNNKKNYGRLLNMFSRFGMHVQAENHNKSVHYRVWTAGNFSDGSNVFHDKPESLHSHEKNVPSVQLLESTPSNDKVNRPDKMDDGQKRLEVYSSSPGDDAGSKALVCGSNPHNSGYGSDYGEESDLGSMVTESTSAPSGTPSFTSSNQIKPESYLKHPLTADSAQREQRILERLQEEKFIITVELHKWLQSLEKEKRTTADKKVLLMDKKTLTRTLCKLQTEGHCRCIDVYVPLVTNCGRNRKANVVLHKSLQSLSPALKSQIQERVRFFDMQSRKKGLAQLKNDKEVPVLANIYRNPIRDSSDSQAVRAEAMRSNGFVLAKMVRAKLLHNFLWGYLRSSPDWDDALDSGKQGYDRKNPCSTCKLFTLAVAIKVMPLELFLQVVGSTQKFENLVQSCKLGLCLADLPLQEYKSLMDIDGTRRLSSLIDMLRRLKLIRLVTDKDVDEKDEVSPAVFTYAMELKPYIEEPLSRLSLQLDATSLDLRPRIRHDFILSNREAVDIYWKTLEYCYATADPKAAIHAFPGSSVPEVYLYRSWASVRVMTADQRDELLKRIVKDNVNRKIPFAECVKIARELNLTVEQVLRVSYDRRTSRLNRFHSRYNRKKNLQSVANDFKSPSQERKIPSKLEPNGVQLEEESFCRTDPEDHDIHDHASDEDKHAKSAEDSGGTEEDGEEDYSFISHCALSRLKPSRRPKFLWTETSDKQLVIQYVRHRAALGARFHRTDWVSLPDLPASPDACKRRMQVLNHSPVVRNAVMRLCDMLGKRYARQLAVTQQKKLLGDNVSRRIVHGSSQASSLDKDICENASESLDLDFEEQQWDDFEDAKIKMALNEVLECCQMAKLELNRTKPAPQKEWSNKSLAARASSSQEEPVSFRSTSVGEKTQNHDGKGQRRASCHRLPGKFLKLLNEGISVSRRAYESLAVANAVELLKLVFLSTSSSPEVPNLLAETLRRYSEHDLFAAFNYLREKKFMVGGNGSQPFVLSQKFLHTVSSSPFPTNTGKRAARFVSWLREREQDLMEDTIDLKEDLQCGDIFHLLALVSSGELFISPSLPDEGVGEAEENKDVKRKADNDDVCASNVKRLKSLSTTAEGEAVCRRAKGFPGIKVSVSRSTIARAYAMEVPNDNIQEIISFIEKDSKMKSSNPSTGSSSPPSGIYGSSTPTKMVVDESPWKDMTSYAKQLSSELFSVELMSQLTPELFKTAHSIIYKAGDQGLCLEQISQALVLQGKEIVELIVDVLQAFGVSIKVNAYNGVRLVDASFRSKYFLTTIEGRYQGLKPSASIKSSRKSDLNCSTSLENYHKAAETSSSLDNLHKVTLLNLPEDVTEDSNPVLVCNKDDRQQELMVLDSTASDGVHESMTAITSQSFRPILPWINGDGTTNPVVYRGLVRRVLGMVMQNPGILEDDVIHRMDVLNPQSCKKLLELMILDNHLIVRKMHQSVCGGPPSILGSLCSSNFKKSKSICREHFFANTMSTLLL